MSLPKIAPAPSPHSSSPSKSSLRRTSGSHNPSTRSLLPSPHLDEPIIGGSCPSPRVAAEEIADTSSVHTGADESTQRQHHQQQHGQAAIAPFQPFFTLVEDAVTREHFHPTVHYIFADDDADIITEAALRSIEQNQEPAPQESESTTSQGPPATDEHGPGSRYLPPAKEGVKEHYVVLDVQPSLVANPATTASTEGTASGNAGAIVASESGYDVVNAYSMSADWQVLRTGISKAPTMAEGEDEGLMLRIEGRSGTPPEAKQEDETVEEMIERFERGLEDVRLVLEASRRVEIEVPEELGAGSR